MRKWMRERLTRRKKTPAESSGQPAPPPLQPAYFDAEQQPGAAPAAGRVETKNVETENVETENVKAGNIESEVAARATPARASRPSRRPRPAAVELIPTEEPSEEQPAVMQAAAPVPGQPSRGRRRRGGRGRGGRGREQAVAQAFAPTAVKGSVPLTPAMESADEELSDSGRVEAQSPLPAAAPKVAVVPAAAQRPPKGVVVLAIGLPGSGKSSWFKRHDVVPLSSDMVRSLLFDDVREQRFQDLVFSNLRSMLKARLIAKRPMNYVDATNLTPQERQHWIKLAKDYQYEVQAIFFDVPLDVCLERHQRRDRVVPEDVMRRMAAKLKPPTFEEGFAKITVVRVKKKD
jgi:predicted kinase